MDVRQCSNMGQDHEAHHWVSIPRNFKLVSNLQEEIHHYCAGVLEKKDPATDLLDSTGTKAEMSNEIAAIVCDVINEFNGIKTYVPMDIRFGIAYRIQRAGYSKG